MNRFYAAAPLLFALACSSGPPPSAPEPTPPPPPPPPTTSASATAAEAPSAAPTADPNAKLTAPPGKLNVILLTIDSLRADMPWAGYPRDIAPTLTAFEKESVSYTRFYSISSYTAMSLGGLLAGKYPSEVERSGYFFSAYPDSVTFFPELLQKAGVKTLAAHAHFYFDQKSGFRQGFDDYEMVPGLKENNKTDENITSPEHLALAEKILGNKANTSSTFFAWFHFMDPHDEYMPHEGIGPYGKSARDRYDGEVTFVDQHLKKLFDFIAQQPWAGSTAILVSSDHGEGFGEHKRWRHGFDLYEMLIHVPLMIKAPGITPRRIDATRSAIDLAPTIFELTGAPPSPEFQGKSLVPELYGAPAEDRDVIADLPRTSDNDRKRALIHGTWKLIVTGDDEAWELYDLKADPGELKDVRKENKDAFEEMKKLYLERSKSIHDICPKHTDKLKGKHKERRC